MDPSFSVGGQGGSQTQDQSVMQSMSLGIVQSQAQGNWRSQTPPDQQTRSESTQFTLQGTGGKFQTQNEKQPSLAAQTATQVNGKPASDNQPGPPGTAGLTQTPQEPQMNQPAGAAMSQTGAQPQGRDTNQGPVNVIHTQTQGRDTSQGPVNVIHTQTQGRDTSQGPVNVIHAYDNNVNHESTVSNTQLQQTVSSNNMFNPGNMNSMLLAPPGTGNSQFNNIGSYNSMINKFGNGGLSVDPSQFFQPRQNPDGSINGAAGNADGPPIMGPGTFVSRGGDPSNSASGGNNNNNNNNYSGMFGPPNFFMNPASSFNSKWILR